MNRKILIVMAWTFAISASGYFLITKLSQYFQPDGFSADMLPFRFSFIVHFTAGFLMIALGPLQFVGKLRRSSPRLHRFLGKTYIIAVLISGVISLYLSFAKIIFVERLYIFGFGLVGLGVASLFTTLTAYRMIRLQDYTRHREWMTRSYTVTLGFTFFRIFSDWINPRFLHLDGLLTIDIAAWGCWIVPLLVVELFLRSQNELVRVA